MTGIDTISNIVIEIVKNVAGTEAERWTARVDVVPVVVAVSDTEVSLIFGAVRVGVSNQGSLIVIMDVRVTDRNEIRGVGELGEFNNCY